MGGSAAYGNGICRKGKSIKDGNRERGAVMFQLPEMILFDYGQTLIDETDYDTIRGNHAVLQRAVSNPRQITLHSSRAWQMSCQR